MANTLLKQKLNSYRDHLIITDKDGVILFMNPAAEEHTGFSFREAKGKKSSELWGGHMPKSFYETMWRTIKEEKQPFAGEVENVRKNGARYWQGLYITPVLNAANEIEFFVGIEPKFANPKVVEIIKGISGLEGAAAPLGLSISSARWLLAWFAVYGVISSREEEEVAQSCQGICAADLVKAILSFGQIVSRA